MKIRALQTQRESKSRHSTRGSCTCNFLTARDELAAMKPRRSHAVNQVKTNSLVRTAQLATLLLFASLASHELAAAPRPAVVELFTSQGCSSCPPADALLSELAARPDVIALAYHVDYWDGLGWRDRYALPLSAQRQHRYTSTLRLGNVFTPQLIIDGQQSRIGSNRSSIVNAIQPPRSGIPITVTVTDGKLRVQLAGPPPVAYAVEVVVVAYLPEAVTAIGRGENAGRKLKETNIVRDLRLLGSWDANHSQFSIAIASLPLDATRAAILLQQPQHGMIVGATTISLR
jgi:hypothetical protein